MIVPVKAIPRRVRSLFPMATLELRTEGKTREAVG